LELHPALVAEPGMGLLTSAAYWKRTHCNRLATSDPKQFKALTKRINGAYSHHAERVALWHKAQRSLGLA
jgi:predicted chitinase